MSSTVYLAVPLMLVLAILQTSVLPLFPGLVLVVQLPFLIALAWGLLRGSHEGVLWAFIAGLFLDLFSAGPMGLTSLTMMAAILIVIWIGRVIPPNHLLLPIVLSGLATIIWRLLYLILLQLFGYPITALSLAQLPTVVLLHSGLILPIYWLMLGALRLTQPRQVKI